MHVAPPPFHGELSALDNIERGRLGEDRARAHLESKGYRFREANYRARLGELDLVMEDGEVIVFVEVRTRRSADFGLPQETIGFRKRQRVVRTALDYLKARRLIGKDLRFDVVCIGPAGLEHIPNAFGAERSYTL